MIDDFALARVIHVLAVLLFVIAPLAMHRRMARSPAPGRDFVRLTRMRRLLLVAVGSAVGRVDGLF